MSGGWCEVRDAAALEAAMSLARGATSAPSWAAGRLSQVVRSGARRSVTARTTPVASVVCSPASPKLALTGRSVGARTASESWSLG